MMLWMRYSKGLILKLVFWALQVHLQIFLLNETACFIWRQDKPFQRKIGGEKIIPPKDEKEKEQL